MTFLNPLLLLGLAAAALPLLIHLFNLRQPRRIDFSSLQFVRVLEESTMRRMKVRNWLLLALRMLALAFLVLAFARPTIPAGGDAGAAGEEAQVLVVVVDNSFSMQARDAEGRFLDQAKELARALVQEAGAGREVVLAATAQEGLQRFRRTEEALEAIGELELASGAASLVETVRRAVGAVEERAEVVLFADLQESTWSGGGESAMDGLSARVTLVPVGERRPANVGVTDVRVLDELVEVGEPVEVRATLTHTGDRQQDLVASLYLEGERRAQRAASLGADSSRSVTFAVTPDRRGWLEGRVELNQGGLPFDDVYPFVLHVPERRQVLVVRGSESSTRYLELALAAREEGMQTETIAASQLGGAALPDYDAVVLAGIATLTEGELRRIADYVKNGGGLLLLPGAVSSTSAYDALLQALQAGRLRERLGTPGSTEALTSVRRAEREHPLFRGMFRSAGADRPIEQPELYAMWRYQPGGGDESSVIRAGNGYPVLQDIRPEGGRALLLTTALDPAWSTLPVRGLFVPLMHRSIYYLSSSRLRGEELAAGRPGTITVRAGGSAPVQLVQGDTVRVQPRQRLALGGRVVEVGLAVPSPGVYAVEQEGQQLGKVVVRGDAAESILGALEPDEAAARFETLTGGPVRVVETGRRETASFLQAYERLQHGRELWNVCIALALILLAAEMVVARKWQPERAAA